MLALTSKTWSVRLLLSKSKSVKAANTAQPGDESSKEPGIQTTGQDNNAYDSCTSRLSSGSTREARDERDELTVSHRGVPDNAVGSSTLKRTTSCLESANLRERFK